MAMIAHATLTLRSRVAGRERWDVPCLLRNPAWTGAVQSVLRGEEGVYSAVANPVTGRVLIEFDESQIAAPVEVLIRQALSFGPLNCAELARERLTPRQTRPNSLTMLLSAELGCTLLKLSIFSSCPCVPALLFAAFLFRSRSHQRTLRHVRVVVDEPSRIADHQDRAEVMQYGGDDWIDSAEGSKT